MEKVTFKIFKLRKGKLATYKVPYKKGLMILDGLRYIQENFDPELSFRWNCRIGSCGSCAVRVNGKPKLACKTKISPETEELIIEPLKTLEVVKDLLINPKKAENQLNGLSPWFLAKSKSKDFFELYEEEVMDVQEMKKCIHCYVCFDACPVIRAEKEYLGPKAIVNVSSFELHPKDRGGRIKGLEEKGLWKCVMSGCCSDLCPQEIKVSENAISYAKEKSLSEKKNDA